VSRIYAFALAAALLVSAAGPARAQDGSALAVTATPARPARGSVVWLTVRPESADTALSLDGTAAGEPLHFRRLADGRFRSLVGIPLEGGDTLPVTLRLSNGESADTVIVALEVRQPDYPRERLRVPPRFAQPDSAAQARIAGEVAQSRAISQRTHDTPRLWEGRFVRPRPGRITSTYGSARVFNGEVTSRHMGTDFAGATGAPVRAANRGVVRIVDRFYYGGNVVYVDHGAGLTSAYLHLSKQLVAEGDTVERGQVIGRVGATGRVTGPHLHLIVRYGRVTVDPMSLFIIAGDSSSTP